VGACEGIRRIDAEGTIAVVSDERTMPYSRCLLTSYICGKVPGKNLFFRPERFYEKNRIELLLGRRAVSVDPGMKEIRLDDGSAIGFQKLLLATGSKALLYEIPGKDLPGVFGLRTLQDAQDIAEAAATAKRAVVMGGGLVGLGAAIALKMLGLEVCVVVASQAILSQNIDREGARLLVEHLERNGLRFVFGVDVVGIHGDQRVKGVRLSDGRALECELVVSAKGVRLNTELAAIAGAAVERGIMVDDRMCTTVPHIYAAGDVAQAKGFLTGAREVMTIWPVAAEQGKVAGMNMAGGEVTYPGGLPMNTVDFFGLPVVSIGETRQSNDPAELEYLTSMDPAKGRYRKVVLRDGQVVGAILIGDTESAGVYTGLMCTRVDVREIRGLLLGKDFDYAKLVDAMLMKDPTHLAPAPAP
jgi:nitrite reductase (NADH) large subunit